MPSTSVESWSSADLTRFLLSKRGDTEPDELLVRALVEIRAEHRKQETFERSKRSELLAALYGLVDSQDARVLLEVAAIVLSVR